MGLAEAEDHRPSLQVLMGHFQSQRACVEIPGCSGVADFQHDVTELTGLNHDVPPGVPTPCSPLYHGAAGLVRHAGKNRRTVWLSTTSPFAPTVKLEVMSPVAP